MMALCLGLYVIVLARVDMQPTTIFGGSAEVFVSSDNVSQYDPAQVVDIEDDGLNWPDIDVTLPQYTIVNDDNLLSSAYEPDIAKDENDKFIPIYGTKYQSFDAAAKPYLDQMLQDMYDAGYTPYVASSYRTYSYQSQLFNTKATQFCLDLGISTDYTLPEYQQAVEKAKEVTAVPGASEHQLGLAVDLYDCERYKAKWEDFDEGFKSWLLEHCAEYGFIQRYPQKKLLLTGWDEQWHFRYVGTEVATFIMKNDLCYEEFYAHYDSSFDY